MLIFVSLNLFLSSICSANNCIGSITAEWKFIVALYHEYKDYIKYNATTYFLKKTDKILYSNHCAGSIINKWQVITAAHCITPNITDMRIDNVKKMYIFAVHCIVAHFRVQRSARNNAGK